MHCDCCLTSGSLITVMALIILFDITTEAVLNMCNAGLHHYTAQKYSKVNFKDNKQNFKKS